MSFTDIIKTAGTVQRYVGQFRNLANNILGQFLYFDAVAVYDQTFRQIFVTARPLKASVNPPSKLMQHPIENGSVITDFRVLLPIEIELSMLLTGDEYASMYQQIYNTYLRGDLLIVTTKVGMFVNMIIAAMPSDETPEMFDVLPMAIRLQQVQIIRTQYQALPPADVAAPADTSTVKSGEQQPKQTGSILYNGVDALKKWWAN